MRRCLILALIPALLLGGVVGCASAPPETQCYKVVNGIALSVDTAMKVAGDLYAQKKITDAQKAQILDVYAKYQHAMAAAGQGCVGLQDANNIPKLTADASAALSELLLLVDSFKKVP